VLDGGADGLVALATTAEASSLDEHERDTVVGVRRGADRRRWRGRARHSKARPWPRARRTDPARRVETAVRALHASG
jgi:hypothetical protein